MNMSTTDVISTVAGKVWKLEAAPGKSVGADRPVLILESMKMEIPLYSQIEGRVVEILVEEGDEVAEGQIVAKVSAQQA